MNDDNAPANILLVDDRPENLLALEAVLEPLGQNLVRATSGEEALKRLLLEDFALILLDVQMPGLDGFETAAHIKQREKTRHIPIIFLTAISGEPHHAARGYSAGAVDYITKPFDAWVLRAKVAVFIDLHRKNRQLQEQADELTRRMVERRDAEEALARQALELERANAELERFTEMASHDLSAPLRTARGFVAAAMTEQDRPVADELLARAASLLGRLEQLLQDLLDYCRAGAGEVELSDVDMSAVVRDTLETLDAVIDESGAKVLVDPLPTVRGDRLLLGTLVQNLLTNAVKFCQEGVSPRIHVSAERAPRAWRFSVVDNGIGIEASDRRRVFDSFRRVLSADGYPGTGVGLATCQRVVERHGGRIWVDPGPDGGSAFRFTIPD